MSMPSFYTPLDASRKEIRLLRLMPEWEWAEISCAVQVVALAEAPRYEALSYVWGSKEDKRTILVDGEPLLVTRNLHAAMRGIRNHDEERVVWIDAICINQFEEARVEREAQVAMMGSIYSLASCVLVYLGEDFEGCQQAMWTMICVSNNKEMHFDGLPAEDLLQIDGVPVADGGIPWDGIYKFLDAPWTTRIWTAQEWALAKKVLVYRSWRKIPGICIQNFMQYLGLHARRGCCNIRREHKIRHDDIMDRAAGAFWAPVDDDRSLLQLMEFYRGREAEDARDRVYGLLGLAYASYQDRVRPDYNISPEDLFRKVALVDEEITGRLDFLSYCWDRALKGRNGGNKGKALESPSESSQPLVKDASPETPTFDLPSWVADWKTHDIKFRDATRITLFMKRYSADGGRRSLAQSRGHRLFTYGVQIAKVDTGCPIGRTPTTREELKLLWDFTKETFTDTTRYSREQSLRTAFWLTMCGGLDVLSRSTDTKQLFYERLKPEEYASAVEVWEREVYAGEEEEAFKLTNLFELMTFRRGFLITDMGDIGFTPKLSWRNDVVVVLAGGSLPYVLRPSYTSGNRNEYTLVGDAYIHGFMHGEAFQMVEEGTMILAPFVIV